MDRTFGRTLGIILIRLEFEIHVSDWEKMRFVFKTFLVFFVSYNNRNIAWLYFWETSIMCAHWEENISAQESSNYHCCPHLIKHSCLKHCLLLIEQPQTPFKAWHLIPIQTRWTFLTSFWLNDNY